MPLNLETKQGFILVGFPGSGKSTVAQKIHTHYPDSSLLASDRLREEMFGTARFDTIGDEVVQQQSQAAYEEMYRRAVELIHAGRKVILDATHIQTEKRQAVLKNLLASVDAAQLVFVLVKTPAALIEERMRQQTHSTNGSETEYEGWKRVFRIFTERESRGELSWPTPEEGVECILSTELEASFN